MHPLSDWYQDDGDEGSFDPAAKATAAAIAAPTPLNITTDNSSSIVSVPVPSPPPATADPNDQARGALEFLEWARSQTAAMSARAAAIKSAQPTANLLTPSPQPPPTSSTSHPSLSASLAPGLASSTMYRPSSSSPSSAPSAPQQFLSMYAAMGGAPVAATIKANAEREELLEQLRLLVVERENLKTQIYDLQNTTPEHVVNLIVARKAYSMSHLRSRDDKRRLLSLANATRSRDAIITVLFFLRIFVEELIRQPDALAVWRTHLKELGHWHALAALSRWQGRDSDAALQELRSAMREPDIEKRLHLLQQWQTSYANVPSLSWTAAQVADQCALLKQQTVLFRQHSQLLKAIRPPAQGQPAPVVPQPPALGAPLSQVIYHLQCFHWKEPLARPTSPLHLLQSVKISEKRLLWLNLRARARMQDWTAVRTLGEVDRWLLGPAPSSAIGFEPFLEVLNQTGGPAALREHFCKLIEPPERRIQLALRLGLPLVAMDTVIQLRDWARAHRIIAEHSARFGVSSAAPLAQRLETARAGAK